VSSKQALTQIKCRCFI